MKTITLNNSNRSCYAFEDSDTLTMTAESITCPNLIIADMNSSNATIHTDVILPEDWDRSKYLFDGSTWSLNPDWEDHSLFFVSEEEEEETISSRLIGEFNTLIKGSGSPTIVFESGMGTLLSGWDEIQTSISANYKTISYDRKGLGESQDTDMPRTIENLVKDLDSLISQIEINGSIILVGHSLGGYIVRKYQQSFPSKVAGLFLIDPANEYLYDEILKQMSQDDADSMRTAWDNHYKKASIGVSNEWEGFRWVMNQQGEWKEDGKTQRIPTQCPLPTNIPITILASYKEGKFLPFASLSTKKNAQMKEKLFSDWKKDKKNIKILNTTNSGHIIHNDKPEWVITELEAYLKDFTG